MTNKINNKASRPKTTEERLAFIEKHLSNTIVQVDQLSTQFNRLLKMLEHDIEKEQKEQKPPLLQLDAYDAAGKLIK